MLPSDRLDVLLKRGGIVKIDGLRQVDHALAAAEAGADIIGIILAASRRQLTPEEAASLVTNVRNCLGAATPLIVGVFVNQHPAAVNEIADRVSLDLVQLHGSESADDILRIEWPVIRAISPKPPTDAPSVRRLMFELRVDESRPAIWIVDAWDPVQSGGTGKRADWTLVAELATTTPLFLAGGLDPDNVNSAIAQVMPVGVDVSSGVETDGVKDEAKICQFVCNAREAFASVRH